MLWEGEYHFWVEEFENHIYKPLSDSYSVIADEIKPLFGVSKIGTVRTQKKRKKLVVYKDYGIPLNKAEINLDKDTLEQIRKTYIFRSTLGQNCISSNFMVLSNGDITSFNEKKPKSDIEIPQTAFEKYFNSSISTLQKYLQFDTNKILTQVRDIINQIDNSHIDLLNVVRDNLFRYETELSILN